MAINVGKLSEKIFKALKSYQLSLSLYTDSGESTLSPSEARRFYNEEKNIMVNLETMDEISKLKVNIGDDNDINEIRPLLDILKKIARTYNIQYVLRTFDRKITPKDFSFQAVTEGFTRPWGTVKTSRRKFENATLYIRHTKRVNEEKRGSRSRNIHSIFIENSMGERFRFPYKNVSGAKAMCVHVSEGGTPYDENGRRIISVVNEQSKLKEFINYSKKDINLRENNTKILDEVKSRIFELNSTINSIHTKSGYNRFIENYEENITEESSENLVEFNIDLPEEFSEIKPFLESVATRLYERTQRETELQKFSNEFLNGKEFVVSEPITDSDANNPKNLSFEDDKSMVSALAGYLSTKVEDTETQDYLQKLSDDVYRFNEKYTNFAKKLLTFLESNAIINPHLREKNENLSEMYVKNIINKLSQFDID